MASIVLKHLRISNVLRSGFANSFHTTAKTDVYKYSVTRSMHNESVSLTTESTVPRSFKREDAKNVYLFVDLPGIPKANVEVTVDPFGWQLEVEGEVKKDYECESRNYQDYFTIPENIVMDDIKAHMKDGVLKVILPKTKEEIVQGDIDTLQSFGVMVN